ncbi:lipid-A-disaccharide synthase N-terminal domain-containing protein [Neptunitalea lumnitzerae]|uniref:Lauroyl acyltransferase n=1 Tax=Neptunitalea lumnitzerae TaxID=2965509 RepID=A0ABQ5MHU2_9FLAO|nr:lipid-A-disaccharide synthase N-terminal domain-containing protein [Neptunitalea sp. Y10]GLB48962.1 lauroyl acyltransferase [Neptunitalea sp. Y10]
MNSWIIYGIGLTAQLLFSWRVLLQWIISEKNKQVTIPRYFWIISLVASFLLFIYGYLRNDFPIILGEIFTYYIYIRNIQLQHQWKKVTIPLKAFLWIFPIIIISYSFQNNRYDMHSLFNESTMPFWLLSLGVTAQLIFKSRFIYQWIVSEKKKESTLPMGFWIFSLTGAILIIIYAIFRADPVLLVGHIFGTITYIRNMTIHKKCVTAST